MKACPFSSFAKTISVGVVGQYDEAKRKYCVTITPDHAHCNQAGRVHGGWILGVFDDISAELTHLAFGDYRSVTVNQGTSFLCPARPGHSILFSVWIQDIIGDTVLITGYAKNTAGREIATLRSAWLRRDKTP